MVLQDLRERSHAPAGPCSLLLPAACPQGVSCRCLLQDGIRVEWEETLDLSQYALRLGLSYLHRLPELLEAYEEKGRLQEAQKVGAGGRNAMDRWIGLKWQPVGCPEELLFLLLL